MVLVLGSSYGWWESKSMFQVSIIREGLAELYENEEQWSKAAQMLSGIDLESGIRYSFYWSHHITVPSSSELIFTVIYLFRMSSIGFMYCVVHSCSHDDLLFAILDRTGKRRIASKSCAWVWSFCWVWRFCRMLDDAYKLEKCVKIALLYLEVKLQLWVPPLLNLVLVYVELKNHALSFCRSSMHFFNSWTQYSLCRMMMQ